MSLNPLELVKAYLASEPARLIAYSTAAVLTAANFIGHQLGYTTLPDGVANGLTLLVTAIVTEAIRRFVYAPTTVAEIVAEVTPPNENTVLAEEVMDPTPPPLTGDEVEEFDTDERVPDSL